MPKTAMQKLLSKGTDINPIQPIKELQIDLFDDAKQKYDEARKDFIKEMTASGWTKDRAEADFDERYADASEYISKTVNLSGAGSQRVIDKVNEVIRVINQLI